MLYTTLLQLVLIQIKNIYIVIFFKFVDDIFVSPSIVLPQRLKLIFKQSSNILVHFINELSTLFLYIVTVKKPYNIRSNFVCVQSIRGDRKNIRSISSKFQNGHLFIIQQHFILISLQLHQFLLNHPSKLLQFPFHHNLQFLRSMQMQGSPESSRFHEKITALVIYISAQFGINPFRKLWELIHGDKLLMIQTLIRHLCQNSPDHFENSQFRFGFLTRDVQFNRNNLYHFPQLFISLTQDIPNGIKLLHGVIIIIPGENQDMDILLFPGR
mmetsp:Transcript_10070/g.15113  ORF Transcript_10070/g.15113 Transcript_10070/m.15113 type:complete len:270 (+) Transcript_10070:485-1294(+)